MKPQVEIYDTTLRDGSQGEGINFSAVDKLRIADKLDQFGVHYIEGGWPGSNPKDMEFFQQAAGRQWRHAQIAAFSMTRRKGVPVEQDDLMRQILEADTRVVTIVGKTWLLHVTEVLRARPDENLAMIGDTIRFLKDHGKTVFYDAEHSFDGFKEEPDYALATWQAAEQAGAECIILCDTNGGCLPEEIARITAVAKGRLTTRLGIHTHNDCGLGVANALAGLAAGAVQVQGTINGYGERTGNCNLTSLIPILAFKMGQTPVPASSLPRLKELSQFVDEIANLRHDPRQPWVGHTAFAHKGGMHVHAIERVARSYEHVPPESVGNHRCVLVSDLAGRTNILLKAKEMGFHLRSDTTELRNITARVKEREGQGFEYEAAEGSLALLIQKALQHQAPPFTVQGYHVSNRRDGPISQQDGGPPQVCQAVVKVKVGNEVRHTVADGDGPINALDKALREALVQFFPSLRSVKLADFKVRIIESGRGTAARSRVLIESFDERLKCEWATVGVSENIIEASLQALIDSMEFRLLKKDLAVVKLARDLGFDLNTRSPEITELLSELKQLEREGYEFEAAEASMVMVILAKLQPRERPFVVEAYHVSQRTSNEGTVCEAMMKVRVQTKLVQTVAEGEGPVNAFDAALRLALVKFFPRLAHVQLTDYKVRILEGVGGTVAGKHRVLITRSDGKREWSTVGVSENIITASLQALVDSIGFALTTK